MTLMYADQGVVMIKVQVSNFIASYPTHTLLEEGDRPEVVMLGRSNVGKSTLVNRITGRKSLANTGKTPGTTKLINVYGVDIVADQEERLSFLLLDFPGFGFGKFSKDKRSSVSREVVEYIRGRSHRRGLVCLLNDAYRDPGDDELALCRLCASEGWELLIIVTKIDRLNQSERHARLRDLEDAYGMGRDHFFITGRDQKGEHFWMCVLERLRT
jgi:GTP-binding protein